MVYAFDKNDYHLSSIAIVMYASEEYSKQELLSRISREYEEQAEDLAFYAKVQEIGSSKYMVEKRYYKKYDQTLLRVATVINDSYIMYIGYTAMDGDVDFNESMIEAFVTENIEV